MSLLSAKTESIFLPMLYEAMPPQAFVDQAEVLLGTPIRFSPGGNLTAALESPSYPHGDTVAVLDYLSDSVEAQELRQRKMHVYATFDPQKPVLAEEGGVNRRRILCWVLLGERCLGHVTIPEINFPLENIDLEQVEMICRYIALSCAVTDTAVAGTARERALSGLLSGSIAEFASLMSTLRGELPQMGNRYGMALFRTGRSILSNYIKSELGKFVPEAWFADNEGMLVAVMPAQWIEENEKVFSDIAKAYQVSVCIGDTYNDIMESREEFEKLESLSPFLRAKPEEIIRFDHYREHALFEKTPPREKLVQVCCCDIIKNVREYDARHGAKWYETLRAFIACDRVLAQTADTLGVHINTVQYRLSRMQEKFDFDLARSDVLFRVMFSIRVLEETQE